MSSLNLSFFAAGLVADSAGLNIALRHLESCLAAPDTRLELILRDLGSIPNLFAYLMSVWPGAADLATQILGSYASEPALVPGSIPSVLLLQISQVLFSLPPDLCPFEIAREIGQAKLFAEDALAVLALLASSDFDHYATVEPLAGAVEDPERDEEEKAFRGSFVQKAKKQNKTRRKNKRSPAIDAAPFYRLGFSVPSSAEAALLMSLEISEKLKDILRFYLELLRDPVIAKPLKDAYTPKVDDQVARTSQNNVSNANTDVSEVQPSAYPMVQPMKAALYFDNAEGFGEWRILISTDATKKLRELTKNDRKKCVIVAKKIRQLSRGHFSEDNQKRLNGPDSGVPIFEAKMQRDLRLIYQVDVVPDHDGDVERQVIKIYGIYTHTQVNRIWDAVGQHLDGKGKEYKGRCTFRNRPVQPGGDIYLPACFPPDTSEISTEPTALALSDQDKNELHSLLVLEKYVTFSQAFLNGLIANQDAQHVFELTPDEHKIVECTTSCYVLGRSGTGKTTTMLFKMLGIQRAWELQSPAMPKPRQIFVTKSRVLATKVEEYFRKLLESLALAGYTHEELKNLKARNIEAGLVDVDDIPDDQTGIPQRYSALEDRHFPLFITFDKLARMIAADILSGDCLDSQRVAKLFMHTDDLEAQDSFVTYDVFAKTYWPRFSQHLKSLEPWPVFSEIVGTIKGSEKSLSFPDGFLDENTYCSLPPRSNPTFANNRQTVYAIFEAYRKLKRERRHYDVADRTHAVLKTLLAGTPLKGQRIDYLYVDEAQDNLLIDALLLRLICRNPEGLFWAGDTAQTISAGSSFRFNDLKAFLYRIERGQSMNLIGERTITDPTAFQLAINYRSHGGIVNCAHSVIERITRFWPDAIDSLQPEHGIVDGLKPVFFRGWDRDTIKYEQFLSGASGGPIELGAQQCILVRDDVARAKLREQVGDIGVIMTLYESKGLEINDVLLYNFFEDSAVDLSRWRVLLNYTEGEVDGRDLSRVHAPSFESNEGRFAGVCSELKHLYVGITRARRNIWIVDASEKAEPMRMVWSSRKQVQNCTPGMDVPRLAVSSTPAEWESFGRSLFTHKRYPQAMHCFERAFLPRMVAIAHAFQLREEARAKVGIASQKDQQQAFLTAADAFSKSGDDAPAGPDKLQYHHNAADCYIRAGDDRKAAIAYVAAQEYDLAARRFRKAGLFDNTLEILHKHPQGVSSESTDELYNVCRLFYISKSSKPPLPLFPSFEEELEFLEEYDLDFAHASLLESHERYLEAAELHMAENRPLDAIRDFMKDKTSSDAMMRAACILLEGLWRRCSFGIPAEEIAGDRDVGDLLGLAGELSLESLDPLVRDEICMFIAIAQANMPSLEALARTFVTKHERNASALLALDHVFSRLPPLKSANLLEMSAFLTEFHNYTRLLYQVISHPDPVNSKTIRRLFCISEVSSNEYEMGLGSFLHSRAVGDRHGPVDLQLAAVVLSREDMTCALRKYLAEHLRKRVSEEDRLCCSAVVFSQCLTFTVTGGYCNRGVFCPQDHIALSALDTKQYNGRIGIHLQQICILQSMYSADPRMDRQESVLDWLNHLYEALNPQFHVQGTLADLDLSLIPGARDSIRVMKHWVRDALYNFNAHHDPTGFLTTVLKLTSLVFAFDRSDALKCINQTPFNVPRFRPRIFIYSDGRYIVEDIVGLFNGIARTSISAGMLFIRHIFKHALYTNLSVLCDCLEEVFGQMVVSWRLGYIPPLDGVVLPRGWLSSNKDFSKCKEVVIALVVELLANIQDLLLHLQSSSPKEVFTLSHTKLTPVLCNVFTARMMLCLLAYNVNSQASNPIRNKISDILFRLRTANPVQRANPLYRQYAYAKRHQYLEVMLAYDEGVVIEDLVHLVQKRKVPRAPQISPRIKQIVFEKPEEIPNLLASQLVAARSDLRVEAPTFVPQRAYIPEAVVADSREEDIQEEEREEVLDQADETHEQPHGLTLLTNEPELIREHKSTEEEISAAHKIQAVYRKYRDQKARSIGTGATAQRNTLFIACLRNVFSYNWQRGWYSPRYLWALPHLVLCLDKAITIAHEHKAKTKGLLSEESHSRLEELGRQRSEINALLKEGRKMRKDIGPNAPMHQQRNKAELKKAVLDVKGFIHRLPTAAPELDVELNIAYGWIMVEKEVAKKERPTLNTEDLDPY
ncbi:hypothetical protein HYDPIDRAFT_32519 [Hydnomerulius pinastri MD-312]|uniref:UvrD-like helicase ATP-binding domain-containing protein n=1 Tax=Hydnomerulius pinastri MD-312 TaxID=994086 RepID=A0A0C9WAE7_9AGAM|nr:hypothetical protein HYDPIDRAFT_32519 [Hydnomerulius pinastri MD-312]